MIRRAVDATKKYVKSKVTPGKVAQAATGAGSAVGRKLPVKAAHKFGRKSLIAQNAGALRSGLKMLKNARDEQKLKLQASQKFVDHAFTLAESRGWSFDTDEDATEFLDVFTEAYLDKLDEMAVGMAPISVIKMPSQVRGGDDFPGLRGVSTDAARGGPRTTTQSGDEVSADLDKKADIDNKDLDMKQTRGPDSYPALSYARKDGQHAGPKATTRSAEEHYPVKSESLHDDIYHSLAGKRTRDMVNQGQNPSPVEIKEIAEAEGFTFGNYQDVENFMTLSLVEKLFPSTGATKHANQMKGDEVPGLSDKGMDIRGTKKGPSNTTTGQNSTGARAAKDSGEAPHRPGYKQDGPKGATQQFEKSSKVCPVCNQANKSVNAFCGACGCVLPTHPENKDGGIPANAPDSKKSRNWNVATDGGAPKVGSPFGGSPSKHHYLKKAPVKMSEDIRESQIPESPRMVLHDLLEARHDNGTRSLAGLQKNLSEMAMSYTPTGVHDTSLKMPSLAGVNAKAKALGLNDINDDTLNRVVGMFQQGETVGKVKLYTGIDVRLCQAIANMLGIGASHGVTRGMTNHVSSANLNPGG